MLNVYTDANENKIAFIAYEGKEELFRDKKKASSNNVASNELEAIKFALKSIYKDYEYENIRIFTDNTNAMKMVDSLLHKYCTRPDDDRLDADEDTLDKLRKYISRLGEVEIMYSPAHCETNKEAKKKFKKRNSEYTVNFYNDLKKSKRKKFIKRMRKRNNKVDQYLKEAM